MDPNTPIRYGASYKSTTLLTSAAVETIFAVAANVNGAIIWWAHMNGLRNGGEGAGLIVHTTPPLVLTTGDVLMSAATVAIDVAGTWWSHAGELKRPVFVPAGKGAYFLSDATEVTGYRFALYTLL